MKKLTLAEFLLLIGLPLALVLIVGWKAPKSASANAIPRGEYLVHDGSCTDGHTPKKLIDHGPEVDASRFLSAHPEDAQVPPPPQSKGSPSAVTRAGSKVWDGPWGVSHAANLTPD